MMLFLYLFVYCRKILFIIFRAFGVESLFIRKKREEEEGKKTKHINSADYRW